MINKDLHDEIFFQETLEKLVPGILKRYKSKEVINTPELDRIVHSEMKKEYLRLILAKETHKATVLIEVIDQNFKYAICENNASVFFDSVIQKKDFDELLFVNELAKRSYVDFITCGDEQEKKLQCQIFGIAYFEGESLF